MFDFVAVLGKNKKLNISSEINTYNKFLKNIDYRKKFFKSDYYELLALSYPDNDKYFFSNSSADVFLMGKVYTNNKYYECFNAKHLEIYSEEISELYENYKKDFIDYIKGIFVIIIVDKIDNVILVYNARAGLFNIYYSQLANSVLISTNPEIILKYPELNTDIDVISVIEYSVFDYPLGSNNLFKSLKKISGGEYLEYQNDNSAISRYYDYNDLINKKSDLNWDDTYEISKDIFNSILDCYIKNYNKILAGLTSGFDSRTNLSRLINAGKNILFYSWGMSKSIEIRIPEMISDKLNINYRPIYLEEEFEENVDYFAKQALMWSGGTGTVRRANHTFGYSKLFGHSNLNITGLFGSEIIRPTNAVGHIFNRNFVRVLFSENIPDELNKLYNCEIMFGFLKENLLKKEKNNFMDRAVDYFNELKDKREKYQQLYYFSFNEGFSKYFGHEITGCRQYLNIVSPYIDDDFVEFIFRTPIPQLNEYAFKRNFDSLKKGQLFYLPIIKKNYPPLMKIKTGRNYTPAQLISVLYPVNIIPGYIRKEFRKKRNDTFNTKKWNNILFKDLETVKYDDDIFNSMVSLMNSVPRNYENSLEENWDNKLAKQYSLKYWIMNFI